jgi:hypothetical protein
MQSERRGIEVPATILFPHAESQWTARELKLYLEHYDSVIRLLVLPRVATVGVPKVSSDDERGQATEMQGRISGLILMVRIFQFSKKPLGNSTRQRVIDSSLSARFQRTQ